MENKINIAELLKDCPKGMELDCTMFDDVKFIKIEEYDKSICIRTGDIYRYLTKFGTWTFDENAKCIIFPKGKTTWEGFQRPFKDGDIIYTNNFIAIFSHIAESGTVWYHCYYCISTKNFNAKHSCGIGNINYDEFRLATEEEKQKLFDAIKSKGYKWNAETKTLEKLPKFKVGDIIQDIDSYKVKIIEANVEDGCYEYESTFAKGIGVIPFSEQDNWELVTNKFDINNLKPFESKVLVRNYKSDYWKPATFGFMEKGKNTTFCVEGGNFFNMCIPYEGNEYLLGTTDNCDEFYKIW